MAAINASLSGSAPTPSANDRQEPSAAMMWFGVVLVWIGSIGVYAHGPAKRLTRELRALKAPDISTSGICSPTLHAK
jgi:hypothetical protein